MGHAKICLCLTARTLAEDLAALDQARCTGVDMVELRADFLRPEELRDLPGVGRRMGIPSILTLRRVSDGGRWSGSEGDRLEILRRGIDGGGFVFVDVEEDVPPSTVVGSSEGMQVIRSFHDLEGVPPTLTERVRRLSDGGKYIAKAAVTPQGIADTVRIVDACRNLEDERTIVVGMGEFGLATRILAALLGSVLTYCSSAPDVAAPGHLTPLDLVDLYRFPRIDAATPVFGVIGDPIAHSASPQIHNHGLSEAGIDGVYLPFRVDDVASFFELAELLHIRGVSVTVPHKRAVIPYLKTRDDSVRRIGACNTLVRGEGGWHGANTDWQGFLRPLEARGIALGKGTKAAVIGSGGVARGVVFALRSAGVDVVVLARSTAPGMALAKEMECRFLPLIPSSADALRRQSDVIVQCTSCGMEPDDGCDPVEFYDFDGHEVAYDLVYRPELTGFLSRAGRRGCTCIGGLEMLLEQAYAQFEMFTGSGYPRP